MKSLIKVSVVLAGYVAACLVAEGAVYLRELRPQWQAAARDSPGMAGFANLVLFVETLGVAAVVPTAMAGCFLRPFPRIYLALSGGCLALAVTGAAAAAVVTATRSLPADVGVWLALGAAGTIRTLLSPVLAPSFLVSVLVGPTWRCRWILLTATAMEGAAFASGHAWLL
jgi:hypothetical protein